MLQVRLRELDSITSDRDSARKEFEDMRKRRLDEFMTGFSVITSKLKEMYQVLNGKTTFSFLHVQGYIHVRYHTTGVEPCWQ